jgi:hypothetical protein
MNFSQFFCAINHSLKAGEGMTCQEFWLNTLSNVIPEVFIAIIFGIIIYKYTSKKEKTELETKELIIREQKIIDYLKILKEEISGIDNRANDFQAKNDLFKYLHLSTDYWETLKSGGEIPLLFSPFIIQALSTYYSIANEINSLNEKYLTILLSKNNYLLEDIEKWLREKIQSLLDMNGGDIMISMIDDCINKSEINLLILNKGKEPKESPLFKLE